MDSLGTPLLWCQMDGSDFLHPHINIIPPHPTIFGAVSISNSSSLPMKLIAKIIYISPEILLLCAWPAYSRTLNAPFVLATWSLFYICRLCVVSLPQVREYFFCLNLI